MSVVRGVASRGGFGGSCWWCRRGCGVRVLCIAISTLVEFPSGFWCAVHFHVSFVSVAECVAVAVVEHVFGGDVVSYVAGPFVCPPVRAGGVLPGPHYMISHLSVFHRGPWPEVSLGSQQAANWSAVASRRSRSYPGVLFLDRVW